MVRSCPERRGAPKTVSPVFFQKTWLGPCCIRRHERTLVKESLDHLWALSNSSQGFFRASLCNTVQVKFFEKIQGKPFSVRRGAQDSYGRLAKLWMTVGCYIIGKPKNIQDIVKSYHRALGSSSVKLRAVVPANLVAQPLYARER